MPIGARGFRSPKWLVEEVAIPLVLKFVDTAKVGPDTTKLEQLEVHQEDIFPIETSKHRGVNEFSSQIVEVSGRDVEEEGPMGRGPSQEGFTKESGKYVGSIQPPFEPVTGP